MQHAPVAFFLKQHLTWVPVCAHRSCITSGAWRWKGRRRESWSRSCSQTRTILFCWRAGATSLEDCSSSCPSAPPLTWSTQSPSHIRLRAARWQSTCRRSRRRHVSGPYRETQCGAARRRDLTLGRNPSMDTAAELQLKGRAPLVSDTAVFGLPVADQQSASCVSFMLWKMDEKQLLYC